MINSPSIRLLMTECNISIVIAVDWTNFCRKLMAQWIYDNDVQLGGSNKIVKINEVKIGHRKYHKGHLITGQWIFGRIERETKKFFIISVKNRKSETLIPIIRRHIAPGSIIYSDSWRIYNALRYENYIHKTIREHFVDPHTGTHT
ncbi:uncharacterized protein LOC116850894 [Odontomachus brunneus]|uniref:uncharacterized protein LOC116850894 n=1 Tax=Odontomachus brunneus TaxID=486640 RepID=UPI0013F193E7|nr:uncharacterized protein LOC116850894 [Odontomachus brunneus]